MSQSKAPALRLAASLTLLWALVVAGFNAWSETEIWSLEQLNARSLRYYSPGEFQPTLPAAASLSARGSLLAATMLAREAARSDGGRRAVFAEEAHAYLDHARSQRPGWASATLVELYTPAGGTRLNVGNAATLLKQSYVESPYLAKEGAWRLQQVIRHWAELDRFTQQAAASETRYLSSLSPSMRVHVRLITQSTPLDRS
jgi:hypothetical protein